MRVLPMTFPVLVLAALAACDQGTADKDKPPAATPPVTPPPPTPAIKATAKPTASVRKEMPKAPPLTEEVARRVLRRQLDGLAGDDVSRQALLYMADVGDRAAVNAVHEKLLTVIDGKYEDLAAAAIGAEVSLAYGEAGAAALVLKVAKQFADDEEDADEFLVHALARVDGPERADATAALVKIADGEDEEIAALAVQVLAKNAAREARESFIRIAGDGILEGRIRASAVAGLLRLNDPQAQTLADKLVAEAVTPENVDGPQPMDVAAGFGIEGAVEAVPYVRRLVDAAVSSDDAGAVWVAEEGTLALVRIHAKDGGAALVPWLKDLAKKSDGDYEEYAAFALWAFGDEPSASIVAATLEASVAAWSTPSNMDPAVEILDVAARLGAAGKPPLRTIVDSAAQVDPAAADKGVSYGVISLNLAASHAFLKSGGK